MMYRNILVAVDDSEKSKTAFRSAVETARAFNAKLTICHIKKNTIIYTPIDPTGMLATTYSSSPGLAIAEVIAPGYDVDLIVCGASNKSGLDRFLLGSVSLDIVKHATCDVNVIRNGGSH